MKFASLVLDDLDSLIDHIRRAVADTAVAAEIVDGIEELHADYAAIIRGDLFAAQAERPSGGP